MSEWKNLSDAILYHAANRPKMPAIIDGDETLDYSRFATLIRQAVTHLRGTGVTAGDHVGVALPNIADHLILVFALIRLGAVISELPLRGPADRRAALTDKLALQRLAVGDAATAPEGVAAIEVTARWRAEIEREKEDSGEAAAPNMLLLTSGSTGLPKALVVTQDQFFRRFDVHPEMLYNGELPSTARPSPLLLHDDTLSYVGFFSWTTGQLYRGGPVVLLGRSQADQLVDTIARCDDAIFTTTPNICRLFLRQAPQKGLLFPRLRLLLSAGQPLIVEEKRRILETVTPNLRENYGCAAVGTISFWRAEEIFEKAASVGRPWRPVDAEIVDWSDRPLPTGEFGRLRVRAPAMAAGYHNESGPMVGTEGFRDGWYYPGEIASFDEDGYLYIQGRAADVIRRDGTTIMPREIEEVLLSHPAVREAAVIGMPQTTENQVPIAVVVLSQEIPQTELIQHVSERLTPAKRPARIYRMRALPRLASGKIATAQLRAMFRQRARERALLGSG